MRNPLLDLEFLRKLDLEKNKTTYAKITLLTWDEEPVEEIQGRITAGSINIDGASAIRRTCSLTMVAKNVNINNTYWALKNKFKLEVGVENTIDVSYPDIIWFKQGLFIFTGLNMSVQNNNFTISINGKDKGCLLNGEVGGSINSSIDFGKFEEYTTLDNGEIVRNLTDIPIIEIIQNLIHIYVGEPLENIIINDVDEYGLELLEYRSDNELYMPRNFITGEVSNLIIYKKQIYYLEDGSEVYVNNTENINSEKKQIIYYDRTQNNLQEATKVWATKEEEKILETAYNIIEIKNGETCGYRQTPLTFPGELVGKIGETLMSILDKIKNTFSGFEYFYDIDGKFIFQKKKDYINTSFSILQTSDNEIYANNAAYTSSYTYSFEDGQLLSAFTSSPQVLNIKNDFSIWGKRKSVSGIELPIHMRYAIDFKPEYYKPIRFLYKKVYLTEETYIPNKYYIFLEEIDQYVLATETQYNPDENYYLETDEQDLSVAPFTREQYDWREIIYQMALDYFKYNEKRDNFSQLISNANPKHYPYGITGYETYYTDLEGFWRQLYHPGVMSTLQDGKPDKFFNLFTRKELFEAARQVVLDERELIEEKNIYNLITDYIYDNFNIIKDNLIDTIGYPIEQIENANDIINIIKKYVNYGFTEDTKVIQSLLKRRWELKNNNDNTDYEYLMNKEKDKTSLLYQTYEILYNYQIDKKLLKENTEEDLVNNIIKAIDEGKSLDSFEIKEFLLKRHKFLILKYGKDPSDYTELIYKALVAEGETSSLYKAYILMEQYSKQQRAENKNNKEIIIKEEAPGKFSILDPYLSFLIQSRQKKLKNKKKDENKIDTNKILQFIFIIIKTFNRSEFFNMLDQMIEHQDYEIDFSLKLIDYIKTNYEFRDDFFYIDNNTKKIIVENAYIDYLLNMRQDKIDQTGGDSFYISNEILLSVILEAFKKNNTGIKFKEEVTNKLESVYSTLDKSAYDFSLEIMNYIKDNFDKKEDFFSYNVVDNSIIIRDKFIQYLLLMRQDKIDTLHNSTTFYPQNTTFIGFIYEVLNSDDVTKNNFLSRLETKIEQNREEG